MYSLDGKQLGSPPRARGVVDYIKAKCGLPGITPAGAGSGSTPWAWFLGSRDHPRGRGEWASIHSALEAAGGSPPRARGVVHGTVHLGKVDRITPAGAGSGSTPWAWFLGSRDHPRGRGEWVDRNGVDTYFWGSPPRARGVVNGRERPGHGAGITPAGAGSGVFRRVFRFIGRDHPRGRGEWWRFFQPNLLLSGSPPRARGVARGR